MRLSSNLQLMRKEWYNAFYNLDIEQLDYLEAEWFFSTNGMKFMCKKNQLHKLESLKQQNPAAFSRYRRHEADVEIRELGNIAAVSGIAVIRTPDGDKEIKFIESWVRISECWKLQFQSFEGEE